MSFFKKLFSKSDAEKERQKDLDEDLKNHNEIVRIMTEGDDDETRQKKLEAYLSKDEKKLPADELTNQLNNLGSNDEDTEVAYEPIRITSKNITIREWLYTLTPVWQKFMSDESLSDEDDDECLDRQFKEFTSFSITDEPKLKELTPLSEIITLTSLNISSTKVRDLSPISELTSLESLYFTNVPVSDLSPLANLVALKTVSFGGYDGEKLIKSLEVFENHSNLESIDFNNTLVTSLKPLAGCVMLKEVRASDTLLESLTGLEDCTELEYLDVSFTPITDLRPIANATQLKELHITGCKLVTDISVLAKLTNLEKLYMTTTRVKDLSPLHGLKNLEQLDVDEKLVEEIAKFKIACPDCEVDAS